MSYQVAYMSKRGAGIVRTARTLEDVADMLKKLAARKIDAIARDAEQNTVGESCEHPEPDQSGNFWWAER